VYVAQVKHRDADIPARLNVLPKHGPVDKGVLPVLRQRDVVTPYLQFSRVLLPEFLRFVSVKKKSSFAANHLFPR
jgi:hypothetical protein